MLKKWRSKFDRWLRHVKFFETGMALVMVSFGLQLILPPDTFATSATYALMAGVAVEWAWGVVCLMIAGAQFFGMFFENTMLRRGGLLFASAFWALVAAMAGTANIASTGWPTYTWCAIFTLYLFWKVGARR